ncbi:MAG: hypothetical protein WBM40_06395, partial [Thiohalocapsa sp.]
MSNDDWLAPPGAGIPLLERQALGLGIRLAARLISKDRLTGLFRDEALRAIDIARQVPEEVGRR